jgi:sugar lactone lactonase YvrE
MDRRRGLDVTAVERFSDALAYHGEGPVWATGWDGLRFVDMLAGDILVLDRAGGLVERLHVGDVAGAFRPRAAGGMVIAVERGFALMDADGTLEILPELWDDPNVRMNEGATDPWGRFYCGSMAYDMTPGAGRLYRLAPDRSVDVVEPSVTCSNGLGWSPDGQTAYYIDSPTQRIDALDADLTGRRPFVTVPPEQGLPDGLAVDSEGGVWVAFYGGSAVRRYSPEGRVEAMLEVPVTQVTACTFGGAALDELYITTSRENVPDGEQPAAGSIFRARPGVTGLPVVPFAG